MRNRTYRVVDEERIEGTWRPIFIKNGDQYFLTDLKVFADGAIWCWEWTDLAGLRRKLASGWVATAITPGARGSAHEVASWQFTKPQVWFTAEELLGEVADMLDVLNDRPDSTDRCMATVARYLESRMENDRRAVRGAYEEIPAHKRIYALGDMDYRDIPLKLLAADLGEAIDGYTVSELEDAEDMVEREGQLVVTEKVHQWAIGYFLQSDLEAAESRVLRSADGPEGAEAATIYLNRSGRKEATAVQGLLNEYPVTVAVSGVEYPTVTHAYWALSTSDEKARERIRSAETAHDAQRLGREAPRRPDWPLARIAVMTGLLRAKFTQHPDLAQALLATSDARLNYSHGESTYWDLGGRNWIGRLLEVIRSELTATRAGIPMP